MQVDFANDSLGHKEEQKLFVPRPFIAPGSGVSKIETMSQGILYGIYCAPMQTFLWIMRINIVIALKNHRQQVHNTSFCDERVKW